MIIIINNTHSTYITLKLNAATNRRSDTFTGIVQIIVPLHVAGRSLPARCEACCLSRIRGIPFLLPNCRCTAAGSARTVDDERNEAA